MLSLILSLALVAAPPPHVAPGLYKAPHRAPDELLRSELPDSAKLVWQAVRKVQSGQAGDDVPAAWAGMDHYASLCNKSRNAVEKQLKTLKAWGWIEDLGPTEDDARVHYLRCTIGSETGPVTAREIRPSGGKQSAPQADNSESEDKKSASQAETIRPPGGKQSAPQADSPTPPTKEESGQGIRSGNPRPLTSTSEGGGPAERDSGGGEGRVFVERMEPVRADRGVNGNAVLARMADDPPQRLSPDQIRDIVRSDLPGYEGPPAAPASVPPSVERSREDAEVDAAIAELAPPERSRLLTSATRRARRQWPGTWPGDSDPSVRPAVARIARQLFTAAAEEAAQPQDS